MERDPNATNSPRRVPRGPALDSTDADLDAAADVTEADIEDALSTWRRDAPREARGLLDAGAPETP